jgi:hypothetical protein
LKHVDLKAHPSLELAMMLIFCYAPYGLAEGVHLSGVFLCRCFGTCAVFDVYCFLFGDDQATAWGFDHGL